MRTRSTSTSSSAASPSTVEEVALTPLEFRLLAAFVRHPGQLLSHDQVLELVWGDSFSASRDQVKLYVGLSPPQARGAGADASVIETVRGFGYRYRPERRLTRRGRGHEATSVGS